MKSQKQTSLASKAARTQVLAAEVEFTHQPFIRPLILSTGAIESITQADARVRVSVDGREAEGRGSIYLSDLWAWPDPAIPHEQRDAAMRAYCEDWAARLPQLTPEPAHPLATGLRLHHKVIHSSSSASSTSPPALARSVCSSIFDAALHDAVGKALECSSFAIFDEDLPVSESDEHFGGDGQTIAAIRNVLLDAPRQTSPAWWVVGKADALDEDVKPHVDRHGYAAFKLKIMGKEADVDAARVAEVYQAARRWGIEKPRLTIDSNEANPDAQSVAAFLDILAEKDADAYAALEMIEQPTGRDIEQAAFDWSDVAKRKPVMVDEGLMGLESMAIAQQQHWSGFALKTCKGHSFTLAAAAWAHKQGMLLSLQDLTNPGLSAVHAGLVAAYLPTMNGVELNSPQFTPAANAKWRDHHPGLFDIKDGVHQLPDARRVGLG